jgi:hypothetical protein
VATRWFSPRALLMHVALVIVVPTFLALCDWQVHRALSGNGLSWAYAFEWPFFAGYAIYMWWKLVHDQDAPPGRALRTPGGETPMPVGGSSNRPSSTQADPEDEELAAYNRYLEALNAGSRPKRW